MAYMQLLPTLKAASIEGSSRGQRIRPQDLDIYNEPKEHIAVLEQGSELKPPALVLKYVSAVRKKFWGLKDVTVNTYDRAENAILGLRQGVVDVYEKAKSDPLSMVRPGCITAAVLAGAIVQGRGKKPFLRLTSATVAGTLVAGVAYPDKAVRVAKGVYFVARDASSSLVERVKKMSDSGNETKELKTEVYTESEDKSTLGVNFQEVMEPKLEHQIAVEESKEDLNSADTDVIIVLDSSGEEVCLLDVTKVEDQSASISNDTPMSESVATNKQIEEGTEKPVIDIEVVAGNETQTATDEASFSGVDVSQEPLADYGQSNPADNDMYSTRS